MIIKTSVKEKEGVGGGEEEEEEEEEDAICTAASTLAKFSSDARAQLSPTFSLVWTRKTETL